MATAATGDVNGRNHAPFDGDVLGPLGRVLPVTAVGLALGTLAVIGMLHGWTNEAIERALASNAGLEADLVGRSRLLVWMDALGRDVMTVLIIRK